MLRQLGAMASDQGDHTRARALLEESLALLRQLRDQVGVAWTLDIL
jgi:hypothetical protein